MSTTEGTGTAGTQEERLTRMEAGRELDALVAEQVMGEDLSVPRGEALALVGGVLTSVTGNPWTLRSGKTLRIPPGDSLPQPEGTTDFNARYFAYVAEHSGEPTLEKLVAQASRRTAKPYSADIALAMKIPEAMRAKGFRWFTCGNYYVGAARDGLLWYATFHYERDEYSADAETLPLAICRAALRACADQLSVAESR